MRRSQKIALTGLLGALALALSYLENLLPALPGMPPGFKLGLSNIASMFAAEVLGLSPALFLAVLKGAFSFLSRGAAAGAMSLSGGLLSALASYFLFRKKDLSYILIGVLSALAHNLGQLITALFLTGRSALVYIPLLMLFGVLTGALTGILLRLLCSALRSARK